ncbi:MAG: TonB family protein [Acidobacteriota bacterium]|nr:TonB family protein [Acidobacteriota bacterium]
MNKQMQRLFGLFLAVLFSVVFVSAQENQAVPKTIRVGVLNGKATSLVKPAYPPAAKAVNASGAVNVQVTIDEEGNVAEATAISGHPLLRAAAVEAARTSKFSPTLLSGQPVKVTGIIVYNFVTDMSLAQIGFAIGSATANYNASFPANTIRFSLPADWTDARQIADSLITKQNYDNYQQAKTKAGERQNSEAAKTVETTKNTEQRRGVVFVMGDRAEMAEVKESYETLLSSLGEAIKNHLSVKETEKWIFALSMAAGKTHAQIEDETKLRQNLSELKILAANAPANFSSELLVYLQKISMLDADGELDDADKAKIREFTLRLR